MVILLLAAVLFAGDVYADDYDVIISGDEGDVSSGRAPSTRERGFSDYFFGDAGGYYSGGEVERSFVGVEGGFAVPFAEDDGLFVLAFEAKRSSIELEQRRKLFTSTANLRAMCVQRAGNDEERQLCAGGSAESVLQRLGFPSNRTLRVISIDTDIAEAFVHYAPLDEVLLHVGRRQQVWGQFDLFSPVSILMPLRYGNNAVDFKKKNFIVPQDSVSLAWFATPSIELQGHFFLNTEIDSLLADVIEDFGGSRDVEDHRQYAVRLLYRPSWGTVGFTFYQGRLSAFYYENARLEPDGGIDDGQIDLAPLRAYAVEVAVPVGAWVWKAEVVYQDTREDITPLRAGAMSPAATVAYVAYVRDRNGGSFTSEVTRVLIGVGADARVQGWVVNLGLYMLRGVYDDKGKTLRRLERAAGRENSDGFILFPGVNVARRFGREERYTAGLVGGLIGPILGVSLYGTMRLGDNMTLYGSGEFVSTLADTFVNEANQNEGAGISYNFSNDLGLGFRFGVRYAF